VPSSARYKIVKLASGVHSVHSIAERETFHPVIGPVAEAEALYVKQLRLPERLASHTGEFVIWDVGLGAAANVLTVLRATRHAPCPLRILSFDHTLEPLQFALEHAKELGYFDGYEPTVQTLLNNQHVEFTDGHRTVTWHVHLGDFPSLLAGPFPLSPNGGEGWGEGVGAPKPAEGGSEEAGAPASVPASHQVPARHERPHSILFDAYSPAKNPAMWTAPLFTNLFKHLDPARPCAMPTYSRSTMLRVTLLLAGFFVGAGHATGEKEETTIAANTPDLITEPLDKKWLQRARNSTSAEPMWEPVYRQAPLSEATWEKLQAHAQFSK
jgi:hypothetical protein